MKKLLFLIPLLVALCVGCNKQKEIERQEPVEEDPVEEDIPIEDDGLDHLISELKEEEYKSFYNYYYQKLNRIKTYKAVTKGETVSNAVIMDVHQSIDVTVIKSEYSYMTNESHSDLVNTYHEVYYHSKKALSRNKKSGDFSLSTLKEYLSIYGTYPFDSAIEGYIVNETTINDIQIEKVNDDYRIKLTLDNEESTPNVKIQMKKFGSLDKYPKFSQININLLLKDDYTPLSIDVDTKYKAQKIMETSCHQQYTVTYSNIDQVVEVPNLDSVKPLFN